MRLLFAMFALLGAAGAVAQLPADPEAVADLEERIGLLEESIAEVELWAQMQDAAIYVPRESRCWTYLEMAAQSREELQALNARYANNADAEYRRQAEILLSNNRNAVEEYRSCFGSVTGARYDKIVAANVHPYEPFTARYNQLLDQYGEGDMGSLWAELTRQLEGLREALAAEQRGDNAVAGTVASVFRDVEIYRNGAWRTAERGMELRASDELRTGPRARARIEFADSLIVDNAGPTVVNVGSNAHIRLESYVISRSQRPARREGVIALIKGTIRAFTRNWGSGSAFHVRYGGSICGIRGTEVVIGYTPEVDVANIYVDHGDAFVVTPDGRELSLAVGTATFQTDGRITNQRQFDADAYANLVVMTAETPDLSLADAMASRPSVLVDTVVSGPVAARVTLPGVIAASRPSQADTEEAIRAARQLAIQHLTDWLAAYGARDWATVIRHSGPDWRADYREILSEPGGEQRLISSGGLPAGWESGCMECSTTQSCEGYLRVSNEADPEQFQPTRYQLELDPNAALNSWMVVDREVDIDLADFDARINQCNAP